MKNGVKGVNNRHKKRARKDQRQDDLRQKHRHHNDRWRKMTSKRTELKRIDLVIQGHLYLSLQLKVVIAMK